MKTPVFSLVALAALSGLFANMRQGRQNSATESVVGSFEVKNVMALRALLNLGLITKEPFGVIEAGDRLCETRISMHASNEPLGRVLRRTVGQIPGYRWYVQNGVVIIEPNSLPQSSASLLRLVIPRFVAPPSSMSELQVLLGMHIQEVLRPDRGVLGDALSSSAEPKGDALDIKGATVKQILSRIVSAGPRGSWILDQMPDNYQAAADHSYIQVVAYDGHEATTRRIASLPCESPK